MARNSRLPPAVHDRLTEQLEKLLDEEEDLKGKKKRITKALNDELGLVADSIYQTRLRLKGFGGDQSEIPGTETGARKRNPALVQVLKAADGFQPEDDDPEEPDAE